MKHMIEAADKIASYVGRGRAAYDADHALRDAIQYQIIVLGEAAKAVNQNDQDLSAQLSEIEWSGLARMADRLKHQYWATDPEIVWSTAERDVPSVRQQLTSALKRLEAQ